MSQATCYYPLVKAALRREVDSVTTRSSGADQHSTGPGVAISAEGTANSATVQGLKAQLERENLTNIAAQDYRLAAAVNGSFKSNPNFSIGEGSVVEANRLGRAWVGDGARLVKKQSDCPGCLISADGTRIYRPPQPKSSSFATTGVQANFVRQTPNGTLIRGSCKTSEQREICLAAQARRREWVAISGMMKVLTPLINSPTPWMLPDAT